MRTTIVTVLALFTLPLLAWAGPFEPYVPPRVDPLPPMPMPAPMTPLPSYTPLPSAPAPLPAAPAPVAAAPAPYIAPASAPPPPPYGEACKTLGECAAEATQCLATKLATRNDQSSEQRFFVQYDQYGNPSIVRYVADIPSDENNAEAADCANDLQSCLRQRCP